MRWLGFYMGRPFWIGEKPTPEVLLTDVAALQATLARSDDIPVEYSGTGFQLRICRDGHVLLRVEKIEAQILAGSGGGDLDALWHECLEYVTCLSCVIENAVRRAERVCQFTMFPLTNRDVCRASIGSDGKLARGVSALDGYAAMYHVVRRIPSQWQMADLAMRSSFAEQVFESVGEQFQWVVDDAALRQRVAVLVRAIGEYQLGGYELAVVLSWFAIEEVIDDRWTRQLGSGGRSKTVKRKLDDLKASGAVSTSAFEDLNQVRGLRNQVVHRAAGRTIEKSQSGHAIGSALRFVTEGSGLNVTVPGVTMIPVLSP